jgi:phytoene dehydrogenase-like protein
MERDGLPMVYDALVIGAGHNGLAAALRLAERGFSVAVVEAKPEAGGAVKTRELTLPGFRHDLAAMNLSMFAGSPFFQAHKETLLAHGLGFAPAEHCFATVFRDDTWLGVSRELDTTIAGIAALSPSDALAWTRRIFSLCSARPCPRSRPRRRSGKPGARRGRPGSTRR